MAPTQQNATADSTKLPTPDNLVPLVDGMRLGDPSSPREQPQPPQDVMMMQQLRAGLPYYLQPHNYVVGETSEGAGYVPPYASCSYDGGLYDDYFGKHSPRLNAPTAPTPSVTPELESPSPSPSTSASQYQQILRNAPQLGAACSAWDGNSRLSPSAFAFQSSAWDRNSGLNPLVCSFQSSAWDRNSGLNPYASAAQNSAWDLDSSHASAFQGSLWANSADYRSWIPTARPARRHLTLEQVRSRLRHRPMESDLLMSPDTAAHVVSLLAEGDERAHRSVLASVRNNVRGLMGSNERLSVLLALVRACTGRPDELEDIVRALATSNGYLMGVAKNHNGSEIRVEILKVLVGAVAPHHQLLVQVMSWILSERFMEQYKGAELLQHCFTTLPYDDSKIIIQFAIVHINELLFSSYGSRCLAECLVYARDGELRALHEIILRRTTEIATGQYSNYFLQRAIELGSVPLQMAIADQVAADVVNLSSDRFGSYVVEACFLHHPRTLAPLQRLLAAFLRLRNDELGELVRGNYSNYVVSKLLDTAKNVFPDWARRLAQKIERLPAAVQREMHARSVMKVVSKLAPRACHGY